MLSNLPTSGVGIGFIEQFRSDLFLHQQQVDFLEIIAEHYLNSTPQKLQEFPTIPCKL